MRWRRGERAGHEMEIDGYRESRVTGLRRGAVDDWTRRGKLCCAWERGEGGVIGPGEEEWIPTVRYDQIQIVRGGGTTLV